MKHKKIAAFVIALVSLFIFTACAHKSAQPWDSAIYSEDTEFGNGKTELKVKVNVLENSVTFTLNTDKATVGEALLEHSLISGEQGPYGLYIKEVNGIRADYDLDKRYWAFYVDGEYAMSGVESTPIEEGKEYILEYAK